jgi:hypothetical protein
LAQAYLVPSLKHEKRLLVSGVEVISNVWFTNRVPTFDEGVATVVTRVVEDLQAPAQMCPKERLGLSSA